ncbi:class-II fumarase/aspartase family protein [Algoriphagus sp.]|uniref:class-II fumarase/aspartase family protein n=1 Tax=Algoriphagus sp. TaxID=1872435 RepID=UPI003F6F3E5D
MPSSIIDSDYFKDMFGTSEMRSIFSDNRRLEAWLEAEVALAKAQEKVGVIPKGVAKKIEKASSLSNLDFAAMKAEFDRVGFPILPFVHQLTKACDHETAKWVHYGATTQDILDTGLALQIKEGLKLIEKGVDDIINALAELSKKYRDTVMPGRTFQQMASPITFGYKTAIWLDEMLRHKARLEAAKPRVLVGQCSGAVGTFATMDDKGLAVQEIMMRELDLEMPDISWHTARDSWAELISILAMICATLGKIATEIAILMRSEIGEVSEPFQKGRGASTTLPQKRNPISCQPIIAIAHRMREYVGSQLMVMIQEHERSVGQMHLEWMIIPEAFVNASGALFHASYILENLVVDKGRMRKNLDIGGGLLMSEAVMMGLAPKIGKEKSHDLVYGAAGRATDNDITLREALMQDSMIMGHLSEQEIDRLLDPSNYTGSAGMMVDAVLKKLAS